MPTTDPTPDPTPDLPDDTTGADLTGADPTDPTVVPAGRTLPCWTADLELWFAERPSDVEDAKALCVPCPLREACLAGALARREPWGVWGGQLLVAGAVVPRKRPRGRPRKHPLPALRGAA